MFETTNQMLNFHYWHPLFRFRSHTELDDTIGRRPCSSPPPVLGPAAAWRSWRIGFIYGQWSMVTGQIVVKSHEKSPFIQWSCNRYLKNWSYLPLILYYIYNM